MTAEILRGLLSERLEWQTRALCRHEDPDIFFPTQSGNEGIRAKAVCNACPVMADCRAYAFTNREGYGVWGATSVAEREQMLRGQTVRLSDGKGGSKCQRLTEEQQAEVLVQLRNGAAVKPLAREYGVTEGVVRRLRDRYLKRSA